MIRLLTDTAYVSAGVPSGTASAFVEVPTLEDFDTNAIDNRISPAPNISLGTLFDQQFAAANSGDAFYVPNAVAYRALPMFSYGILTAVPPPSAPAVNTALVTNKSAGQNQIRLRQKGVCQALCVTPSSAVAIAVGTLLASDGNGNLQPFQPPSAAPTPTVTPVGTTGATTYTYKLAAVSLDGVATVLGTAGSTTTGNATLSNANYNQLTWTPVADAAYYIIVRTVGGATQGVIGIVPNNVSVYNDTGLAATENTSATVYFPTLSAPGTPTVAQVTGAVAGTSTDGYKVTAVGPNGVWSAESTEQTLTTSNATLSVANANKITWTAVTGAAYYVIDRSTAATGYKTGVIGFSNSPTAGFLDYGQAIIDTVANLTQATPAPIPRPGTVLAIGMGALAAGTTTATLTQVNVGGF